MLLWRHAPTAENAQGILQGQTDTDPGGPGLELAHSATEKILHMYGKPAALFSSPLRRASATAKIISDAAGGLFVEIEPGINQRSYGAWEGRSLEDIGAQEPEQLLIRNAGGDPDVPGWETGVAVGARVARAIEQQVARVAEQSPGAVLVFVSHGSAISTGIRTLLGISQLPPILGHLNHANWVELNVTSGKWAIQRYNVGPL